LLGSLQVSFATVLLVPMPVRVFAANPRFVNLDDAAVGRATAAGALKVGLTFVPLSTGELGIEKIKLLISPRERARPSCLLWLALATPRTILR
jgi:hypothetical protein